MQEARSVERPDPRRRQRIVRLLATASITAGIVLGFAPTAHAADFGADTASPTYTCVSDNDPTTTGLLGALGGSLALSPQISVAPLTPGPAEGASFTPQFSYSADLPPAMVAMGTQFGLTGVTVSAMTLTIAAGTGVTGGPLVAPLPNTDIYFATPTGITAGPLSGSFTRTAADGQSMSFVAGNLKMSIALAVGGPASLKLLCTPAGDKTLTLATSGGGTTSTTATTAQPGSTSTSTSNTVPGSVTTTTAPPEVEAPSNVEAGGSFAVSSPGWEDGSEVTATLHSDPIELGKLQVGNDGVAEGNLTIPASVPAGSHTLKLTGTGDDGDPKEVTASLTVTEPVTITSLPAGSTDPTYTCASDNDATTTGMLGLIPGGVTLAPHLTMAAISPSPEQGDSFTPQFGYSQTLPESMVGLATTAGVASVSVTGITLTVSAGTGVSGGPLVATLPDQTVVFANSTGFSAALGGTAFTRTSAVGDPVSFVAGDLKMSIGLTFAGNPITLKLACTPSGATTLTVTDVEGTPPPDTKNATTTNAQTGPTTTAATGGSGELARTGGRDFVLTMISFILIGLGIAAFNEGALRKWRRSRTLR